MMRISDRQPETRNVHDCSAAVRLSVLLSMVHATQLEAQHGGSNADGRTLTCMTWNDLGRSAYTLCLKKTGPLLHFQITATILVQYQQILVQRIVN